MTVCLMLDKSSYRGYSNRGLLTDSQLSVIRMVDKDNDNDNVKASEWKSDSLYIDVTVRTTNDSLREGRGVNYFPGSQT